MVAEITELMETVEGMAGNYKERFRAEYQQTKLRYEKLKDLNNRIEAAEATNQKEPCHDCPAWMLKDQQRVMGEYLHILEVRAVIEDIEL
jgi:hypothetical protein